MFGGGVCFAGRSGSVWMCHSMRKWCSAGCGLLSDGAGPSCGPALRLGVRVYVNTTHVSFYHSSSCFQAEQFIMSSSDKKSSSSPEQKPSSKEQQTSPSGAEYVGVVRHPALSTYYVHKDILNMPVCKTPDFEAARPGCTASQLWPT